MRTQAWHFRTEFFPKLTWILMSAPTGHSFIASDRPVVWFVPGSGFADSPGALNIPDVQLSVPLDSKRAFLAIGKTPPADLAMTVQEINRRTACYAEKFIVAPDQSFGGILRDL
jgi:hypothetical protein